MLNVSETWDVWTTALDRYMKNDVYFYRLKQVHAKSMIRNESMIRPQIQASVGQLDFLLSFITERADTIVESTIDEFNRDACIQFLKSNGKLRVGCFEQHDNTDRSFYLISSDPNEDSQLFVRCDLGLYDSLDSQMYYELRYEIDRETYYELSGMTEWIQGRILKKYGIAVSPCPDTMNEPDQLRFNREFLDGIDLQPIRDELEKIPLPIRQLPMSNPTKTSALVKIAEKFDVTYQIVKLIFQQKL